MGSSHCWTNLPDGPGHGATCSVPSPASPKASTALPSSSTTQIKNLSLGMTAYLFQSAFPPETPCFPHSRGRFKNRTASDLCRVNILFSWLAWLNSMCCMVSKDHSQLQAAQFLEAEKRHILSLEMSHTVNLSSIS